MKAKIFYKKQIIEKIIECGSKKLAIGRGFEVPLNKLRKDVFSIQCCNCGDFKNINYYSACIKKEYLCMSCNKRGELNPFYNKQHSDESKIKIGVSKIGKPSHNRDKKVTGKALENIIKAQRKAAWKKIGKNNPFYGKKHPDHLMQKIVEKSKNTRSKWTDQKKNINLPLTMGSKYSIFGKRI